MFRQFGRFAPLALCLFAITIVMGCGGSSGWWNGEEEEEEEEEVELTPMEKLAGTYELVESEEIWFGDIEEPPTSGTLRLRPEGNGWTRTHKSEDGSSSGETGTVWIANATTIAFVDGDGVRNEEDYTLDGKFLTLALISSDGDYSLIEKWRKID